MLIKIRFPQGPNIAGSSAFAGKLERRKHLANEAGGLLTMAALAFSLLAAWRLTSDLDWTGEFFIADGIFSHWQVWLALGIATGTLAYRLRRFSQQAEEPTVTPGNFIPKTAAPTLDLTDDNTESENAATVRTR